jgi:hypothetical protein
MALLAKQSVAKVMKVIGELRRVAAPEHSAQLRLNVHLWIAPQEFLTQTTGADFFDDDEPRASRANEVISGRELGKRKVFR